MGAFELAFYGWREGAAHKFFGPNNATDLWHVKKVNPQSMIHLTEKPVELAVTAIQYGSRTGENVLDLFGGSGSTLIGCEQTGRKAFLIHALERIHNRAKGQLCNGQHTRIVWTADEIVLPTIPDSKASGAIIRVAGIESRIRGMKFKRADGRAVRPSLVVLDDPQTDESARSERRCSTPSWLGKMTSQVT